MSGGHNIPAKDSYTNNYTTEDFISVLLPNKPRSVALIMKEIGCAKNTAKKYLQQLEEAGLAEKVHIEGSTFGWIRSSPVKTVEIDGFVNENGFLCVDKQYAGTICVLTIVNEINGGKRNAKCENIQRNAG